MSELRIIATIEVKENFVEDVQNSIIELVDATRKEEGCILYELHKEEANPLKYIILELWKSKEMIEIHNETPHFKKFVWAIDGKITNLNISVVEKIY